MKTISKLVVWLTNADIGKLDVDASLPEPRKTSILENMTQSTTGALANSPLLQTSAFTRMK
jgi:hypothetical protein